jgi:hypothetical protein
MTGPLALLRRPDGDGHCLLQINSPSRLMPVPEVPRIASQKRSTTESSEEPLGFFNYCGDYAGFAEEFLQEHRPGFTALFLMGCGGDQNPYPRRSDVVPGITDLELAQQHGRALSNAVEVALSANPRPVGGPFGRLMRRFP